ncbi:hypothetical protein V2G26_020505 [Clonostachys chloroleuca]
MSRSNFHLSDAVSNSWFVEEVTSKGLAEDAFGDSVEPGTVTCHQNQAGATQGGLLTFTLWGPSRRLGSSIWLPLNGEVSEGECDDICIHQGLRGNSWWLLQWRFVANIHCQQTAAGEQSSRRCHSELH